MDLKNKLKGLPTVYYFNLDNRTDRRELMEEGFEYIKVKNYKRISGTKYLASKHNEWKHLYYHDEYYSNMPECIGNLITHIEAIKYWLENTNEKYLILIEDDVLLQSIDNWHFDWEYLMNNIPYDWDCIQLSHTSFDFLYFFLHPKRRHSYFGPVLINRNYAEKLVRLHFVDGKYKVYNKVSDFDFINPKSPHFFNGTATVDYALTKPGKTYCMPLIRSNLDSGGSYEDYRKVKYHDQINCTKAYDEWWKNDRDKFTLKDFFTYGKPYDYLMMKYVPHYPPPIGIV